MTGHPDNSSFFNTAPTDWTIEAFLKFSLLSSTSGLSNVNNLLHRWIKALRTISNCHTEHCCPRTHRDRAKFLIARFEMKGRNSDKTLAKRWLREWNRKQRPAEPATLQSPVTNNVVFQHCNSAFIGNHQAPSSTIPSNHPPPSFSEDASIPNLDDPEEEEDGEEEEEEKEEEEEDGDDDDTYVELGNELIAERGAFMDLLRSMKDQKWLLSSGRYVEDVIREVCHNMPLQKFKTHLLRSFVLDLSDPAIVDWFTAAELDEIQLAFPPLPQPDKVLVESLTRFFEVTTTQELDNVLQNSSPSIFTSPLPFWSDLVHRNLLNLFVSPTMPLCAPHLEAWYTSFIWSHVIDFPLVSLPVNIIRDEAVCRASSLLLNRTRVHTGGPANRQRVGRRLDGIICTNADNFLELGAIEVAKSNNGPGSTKSIQDGKKLRIVLRDMISRLHDAVDDHGAVKKVQTVGILNAGLTFQMVRCWGRNRGGVVLVKSEKQEEFPRVVGELRKVWFLLRSVAQMREIVDGVRKIVEEGERKTKEEIADQLLRGD